MRTLKILGFLLTYPTSAHQDAVGECRALLQEEQWISGKAIKSLDGLFQYLENSDLLDLQEDYVALFDRTPSLSLHLFEHVHGDSRDRGQALADLLKMYEEVGLFIKTEETPDYLPLFAEYLSTLPPEEASEAVGSIVNILSSIGERLKNRDSFYAGVFEALIEVAARSPDATAVENFLKKSTGMPLNAEQIDQEWEEQFAFDNTPQTTKQDSGCPKSAEVLARMNKGMTHSLPREGA